MTKVDEARIWMKMFLVNLSNHKIDVATAAVLTDNALAEYKKRFPEPICLYYVPTSEDADVE